MFRSLALIIIICSLIASARADEQIATYRILGLCSPDRVEDLRECFKEVTTAQIESIDFDKGECTLRFDLDKIFPGVKPDKRPPFEDLVKRFSERLNGVSHGTFKLRAIGALPREKLQRLDLKVGLLDCKACRLGAYFTIANIVGVEQVNVAAEGNLITAWIDPAMTNREALVDALKKAGVDFTTP
jgi:hypothetical protein